MTSARTARDNRAEKVAAARAATQKAQTRRRQSIIGGVVVAVLVVTVAIGALVQAQRNSTSSTAAPAGTRGTANQTIAVGAAGAAVTITVYEDYQCPACKNLHDVSGATLQSFVDKGTARVEYRAIAFLDRFSSTEYATRALNAAGCVVNAQPAAFTAFHGLLMDNQPAENTPGLTDAKLAELATEAGAPGLTTCINERTFGDWTKRVTDQSSKDKISSTPTVLVNGTVVQNPSPAGLTAAVTAAGG